MAPILGTRWRFRPVGGGTFHCPRCDRERDYTATATTRVLGLFGRGVLPVGPRRTLLACDACGAVYDVTVTTLDPVRARDIRSEDELALDAVLAAMVFSDSAIREVEKDVADSALRRYAHGSGRDPEGLADRLARTRRELGDPFERLAPLAGILGREAKRGIVAAAYRVCAADRELHPQEARLIMRVGEVLGLHPRQVREAMREGTE